MMASNDAQRWDERYRQKDPAYQPHPQEFLIKHSALLPGKGRALDIAMGLGGSAAYLAGYGLSVIGIDISEIAVRQARTCFPGLQAFVADLEHLWLPENHFDLIVSFYYLDRGIWPTITRALRPGGLFYFETFQKPAHEASGMNPDYLLESGEMITAFPELEILIYEENQKPGRGGILQTATGIVARKPV